MTVGNIDSNLVRFITGSLVGFFIGIVVGRYTARKLKKKGKQDNQGG